MHDVQAAETLDEEAQRELESRAAGLKVAQTWHATRTIQLCREACGGAGYLQENRLPHLKADTNVFTTFEGDNTVLLQLVAKGLLTGYRDAFGSLEGWGKVGFIADMVRETVLERTAARADRAADRRVPSRNDDEIPMLTRGWQLKMLEFREKHALEGAIRRLRKNSTEGMAPFDMFNDVQDHVLLKTAQTHIDRVVMEAFVEPCRRTTDPAANSLDTVCDLCAVHDRGGQGLVPRARPAHPVSRQAAHQHREPAARELRPHMRTLVDAFAIPHEWKAAQILEEEADRQEAMAARTPRCAPRPRATARPAERDRPGGRARAVTAHPH